MTSLSQEESFICAAPRTHYVKGRYIKVSSSLFLSLCGNYKILPGLKLTLSHAAYPELVTSVKIKKERTALASDENVDWLVT